MRPRRPSPALAVALLALMLAAGGTSWAAFQLPRGSVTTSSIRTGAVTSSKVRDGTLRARDFAHGTVVTGARGPQGPPGPPGKPGDSHVLGWALVLADGTVATSWNVPAADVVLGDDIAGPDGTTRADYCFELPYTAKAVQATPYSNQAPKPGEVSFNEDPAAVVAHTPGGLPDFSGEICPQTTDPYVVTYEPDSTGKLVPAPHGFYVTLLG